MNDDQRQSPQPLSAISADGTKIAYEKRGQGPALLLIGGALNDRFSGFPRAELLKADFTVYTFDRRGRGGSANTVPYAPEREVEDVAALLTEMGNPASIYGHSSGGFLALLAAVRRLRVSHVAVYEPPYAADEIGDEQNAQMMTKLEQLIDDGHAEEALTFFFGTTGMPPAVIEQQRLAPHWPSLVAKAPTLINEYRLKTALGSALVPVKALSTVSAPVQAMAGSTSPEWMKTAARQVASSVSSGVYLEVPGQNHMVANEVIAPILKALFQA